MSNTDVQAVSRLVDKLEKWRKKRELRGLESIELNDAIKYLRDYATVLGAAAALQHINLDVREGGKGGSSDR